MLCTAIVALICIQRTPRLRSIGSRRSLLGFSHSQQITEMRAKAQPRSAAATEHGQEAPLLKAEHAAFAPNIKDSRGPCKDVRFETMFAPKLHQM